ncbi:MAG: amino acid ABC transporter permease [Bacilli bacterium]|nr:amino acid ABC transporter permease [Bacilli bacterium]
MNNIKQFFIDFGNDFYRSLIYENRYQYILEGLKNTILISLLAVLIGVLLGILVALLRHRYKEKKKGKFLDILCRIYVSIIRGTPVLLQLMILYYIIFRSIDIPIVLVGMLAFGINSGAYVSEIIRAGIESVDKGQNEAARSLGLTYAKTMRYVILPQAIKNVLPALGNEFITLLKETSVAGYIGIIELTKASDIIASTTYDYFFPLILVALIYLIMTLSLSKLLENLERKLDRHA